MAWVRFTACSRDAKISVEKIGERGSRKTAAPGSGLISALDESGAEESHVGRMLHILVRPAADSTTPLD
jgi:hypothetical protein